MPSAEIMPSQRRKARPKPRPYSISLLPARPRGCEVAVGKASSSMTSTANGAVNDRYKTVR